MRCFLTSACTLSCKILLREGGGEINTCRATSCSQLVRHVYYVNAPTYDLYNPNQNPRSLFCLNHQQILKSTQKLKILEEPKFKKQKVFSYTMMLTLSLPKILFDHLFNFDQVQLILYIENLIICKMYIKQFKWIKTYGSHLTKEDIQTTNKKKEKLILTVNREKQI